MLGKELKLFTICPLVGPGLILWMPKGAIVRGILENFIKDELIKRGYQPVYTPHIGKLELYQTSGHYPVLQGLAVPAAVDARRRRGHGRCSTAWTTATLDDDAQKRPAGARRASPSACPSDGPAPTARQLAGRSESYCRASTRRRADRLRSSSTGVSEEYLLKPMNCPHHIQIYKAEPRSYRDLPVRLAEFGTVYRYEQSGELSGMTRVRGFTQDDAHLFCTDEQVRGEFRGDDRADPVRAQHAWA